MDINQQYPTLDNDILFDIESLSNRLGLSSIDIIHLARSCDVQTAEYLCGKSNTSIKELFGILRMAKKLFIADSRSTKKPILPKYIPTTLKCLDKYLQGGIPLGTITEVFGVSGCGKSQFLLWLAVKAQIVKEAENIQNTCIYISTEATLESRRLVDFSQDVPGALDRISYFYCVDIENQDHILFTQLPLKLQAVQNEGKTTRMVIIDSVAHHLREESAFSNSSDVFRAYLEQQELQLQNIPMYHKEKLKFDNLTNQFSKGDNWYSNRKIKHYYLFTLYSHLAELALGKFNVAVVLANQVSDVVDANTQHEDPLELNFQIGTFSGWDESSLISPADKSVVLEPQNDRKTMFEFKDTFNITGPEKKLPGVHVVKTHYEPHPFMENI
ncbi:hypothetical protein JCM33374_g5059 [Metschnikowia sp. JCM 33374]|nr:hypothetical protein JCM33374_g5059 [Metschnikowia sp. JCM 33374]